VNRDIGFDTPRHSVRVVANLTGLSAHVLRAWERRYEVVTPHRSPGGQRLYSDHDLERLRRLSQLTGRGHSISRIAGLSLGDLERLEEQVAPGPVVPPEGQSSAAAEVVGEALGAVGRFQAEELQAVLQRGAITLGRPVFLNEVVSPAVEAVGDGWSSGALSVAQEHMSTAVFRRVLEWQLAAYQVDDDMPRLAVATPPHRLLPQ
jgi:DNA-binding transcriptional MerR regulator